MENIDNYLPEQIVTDEDLYESGIESLFETALTKTNTYHNNNEMLIDFSRFYILLNTQA